MKLYLSVKPSTQTVSSDAHTYVLRLSALTLTLMAFNLPAYAKTAVMTATKKTTAVVHPATPINDNALSESVSRLRPSTSGEAVEFTPVVSTPPNPMPVTVPTSAVTLSTIDRSKNSPVTAQAEAANNGNALNDDRNINPSINNGVPYPPSYELAVPSNLTLAQAQQYLLSVSPKIAADNAAIVSNERLAESTKDLNKPLVFVGASATHVHIDDNIDTTGVKNNLTNAIDNAINTNLGKLPVTLPLPSAPDVGGLLTSPLPSSIPVKVDKNNAAANLTVLWSAYNGHKTQAVTDLLHGMTDESRADASLSLDEQYTTLAKRYFQTQLAIMAAYLRADALNAIRATDHAAQRALDVGLISKVERLEAKKALADAEYENSKALNDAELAMTALQRLLRTPYFVKPTSPLFVSTKPLPPLSYFQQQAKMHHPGFDKVAAKYHQAKALHAFNESAYKPNVTVFGRSEIASDPNWIAGVSANWKLWGGIDRKSSSQSSLAKMHQAEFSQVDANDNIMLWVEKNWQTVSNARDNFIALNTNIELAGEMLRYRQLGFKEGVSTAVDVMQAQANLEKAKTEQAKAANDYVQALADLMQSCGTPLEFNRYMQAADIKLPAIYFEHTSN